MSVLLHHRIDPGEFVRRDPVLVIACALALGSCAAVPPDAGYADYVDLRTLGMLFSLMTVTTGLSRAGAFSALCSRLLAVARVPRRLSLVLVLLSFFSSMLITNDVALVTFVPLALLALGTMGSPRLTCLTVALMTVAANLGSMFTPVGNPQNLYLYSASRMGMGEFLALTAPYALTALALLVAAVAVFGRDRRPSAPARREAPGRGVARAAGEASCPDGAAPRLSVRALIPWIALFACALASVAHALPYQATVVIAVLVCLAFDRGALAHVDYGLLATFVAFFVFVGNVGRIGAVHELIAQLTMGHEFAVAVLSSQVLSNVPAAILLSGFTSAWPALIVGTNVGGLGTLIASMASLISYKQLALCLPREKGRYIALFTLWNAVFLVVLVGLALAIGIPAA